MEEKVILPILVAQLVLMLLFFYMLIIFRNDLLEIKRIEYNNGTMLYDIHQDAEETHRFFVEEFSK